MQRFTISIYISSKQNGVSIDVINSPFIDANQMDWVYSLILGQYLVKACSRHRKMQEEVGGEPNLLGRKSYKQTRNRGYHRDLGLE